MVQAGCVFVAGIHPPKIFCVHAMCACVHRLGLGLYSHPERVFGNGVRTHDNSKGKISSTRGSEESGTRDAASHRTVSSTHRLSYSGWKQTSTCFVAHGSSKHCRVPHSPLTMCAGQPHEHHKLVIIIIIIQIKIIIITVIAFKGATWDILQSPHCATNCLQHERSSGQGAIVCTSRATHGALIMCNMSWYVPHGSKEQLSYQVWEFKSHLF